MIATDSRMFIRQADPISRVHGLAKIKQEDDHVLTASPPHSHKKRHHPSNKNRHPSNKTVIPAIKPSFPRRRESTDSMDEWLFGVNQPNH